MDRATVTAGGHEVRLEGGGDGFRGPLSSETPEDLLDRIPPEHVEMLGFWLAFWREHRDILLDGALEPHRPEATYPVVLARTDEKLVAAAYAEAVVSLRGGAPSRPDRRQRYAR